MDTKIAASADARPKAIYIEGLNTSVGIHNVDDKPDIYREVLESYVTDVRMVAPRLTTLFAMQQDVFYTKIHGIKSNCQMIGDEQNAEKARLIETAYVNCEDDEIERLLPGLVDGLKTQANRIETFLEQNIDPDLDESSLICNIPGIPRPYALMLKEALLDMELAEIEKHLASIKEKHYEEVVEGAVEKIEKAVKELDYDTALAVLEENTEQI
ncbi:MAG: hypothetical protein ILP10_06700 [Lachnospiraceae bacterium]|nr:hypothetical protein [Lachnospiraceae bacterium]